jgi:NADPH-dependent 2,4-dienoyl-CoA reductase/sulfur reductase-like enzyme
LAAASKNLRDLTQHMPIALLQPGCMLLGRVGRERALVWRHGETFYSVSATCPHLGGPLDEGIVVRGAVRCPWHHACFDIATGEAKSAPAFDPLTRFSVEVEKGHFFVVPTKPVPEAASRGVPSGRALQPMVIVGGGAAAFAAANALRRHGWQDEIFVYSAEDAQPYDRTLLTKDYLDGNFGDDRLSIAHHNLAKLDVRFENETPVEGLEPIEQIIRLKDGRVQHFGKLLLATGAEPRRPDVRGADLAHVFVLRSLADCRRILSRVANGPRIAVIGGSFIAMEAAASLRSRGLSVSLIAPEQHPMAKIFGQELSDLVVAAHREKGVELHFGSKIAGIEADAVVLENGETIAADLVIAGIGVTPRVELAKRAGLAVDNGIPVDSRLRTSAQNIFAAGDIAQWPDPHSGERIRVEHWVVAERQGEAAAANMAGADVAFEMVPFFWTKHFDLAIRYIGHARTWDELSIDGDLSRRDATIHFRKDGRVLAIATVGRDRLLLEAERTMERQIERDGTARARGSK